jgi:hypothetical protein
MPKYTILYQVITSYETDEIEANDAAHAREIFLTGGYEGSEDREMYSELDYDSVDVLEKQNV